MRFIGESISDAIDWTQDRLCSTRPVAETVLFSLLADKKARETEQGFVLTEDDDELERRGRLHTRGHRPRFRFHSKRQHIALIQRGDNSMNIDVDEAGDH